MYPCARGQSTRTRARAAAAAQVAGSVMAAASHLVVGKEGALLHVGACAAHLLASSSAAALRALSGGATRLALTDNDVRDLVAVGAAAGTSAAFRAPVRRAPVATARRAGLSPLHNTRA
jgi:H+/Cl- antiporter ClcA